MPMQHVQLLIPHGEEVVPIHALDGPKANLRRIALTQLATECSGDNLVAQAHAKYRLAYGHGRFGQLALGL